MKLKQSTTHVILTDSRTPGKYYLWTEHRSEAAALRMHRALGRNRAQGHTVAVPVSEIGKYPA